jgi:hypothetical protein
MRYALLAIVIFSVACGRAGSSQRTEPPARITKLDAPDGKIPQGVTGKLCYGVENAVQVKLTPPDAYVWPSSGRCVEIQPQRDTVYTLTAFGAAGSWDSRSVSVKVIDPPPRLYDITVDAPGITRAEGPWRAPGFSANWAEMPEVLPGAPVVVCFKTENTRSIKASPGRLDPDRNCLIDNPSKTTVYRIMALGRGNQMDSGTVTVRVQQQNR